MASLTVRSCLALVVWAACLTGTLALAELPIGSTHGICGPWGCGPPTQALLACHLAWLVVLVPPAVLLTSSQVSSHPLVQTAGLLLIGSAVVILLAILTYQRVTWWSQAIEWQRPYFWQRYGFSIAIAVDFPILQAMLVGIWLRFAPNRVISRTIDSSEMTLGE